MPKGVNVNWIKHLRLENENRIVRDSTWFRSRDRVSAEFSVTTADSSKLTSFIGTREVVYTDVRIGEPIPAEVIRMDNNVVIGDQGQESSKDEAFWESVRPYRLSDKEKGIYSMVDSVQNVPLYRNIYTLINTVIVGYWNTKYIGIGPYYKLASSTSSKGSACSRDSAPLRPSAAAYASRGMRHTARATGCSRAAAASSWLSTAG